MESRRKEDRGRSRRCFAAGGMISSLLLLLPMACVTPAPELTELAYATELGVDLSKMTQTREGLYFQDISQGVGEMVGEGDHVTIHYLGWFVDGKLFDSSLATGEPIDFVVGAGQVIEGWELGVVGMREGGRRRLLVPPSLGYGLSGISGAIPGNAVLLFEVQLLRVGW